MAQTTTTAREQFLAAAQRLHRDAPVVDGHYDLLYDVRRRHLEGKTTVLREKWVPLLRKGGVDVQFLPVYVDGHYIPDHVLRLALQAIDAAYQECAAAPGELRLATTCADIQRALDEGKMAFLLSVEGLGEVCGSDLALLRTLHRLGVRSGSLTWNRPTVLADGLAEAKRNAGLTQAGVEFVKEMERLRMLIDLSHITPQGFWDVLENTTSVVVATHSNCKALCDHPRNLTDEQIGAIAQRGGVVGLLINPMVIDPKSYTLERAADHVEHIMMLVGAEHVSLGIDFVDCVAPEDASKMDDLLDEEKVAWLPVKDLETVAELPNLTAELLRRGHTEEDVRKFLGGNLLRVLEQVLSPES